MTEESADAATNGGMNRAIDAEPAAPATETQAIGRPLAPGDRVRVAEGVRTRYFPQSEQARRAGWTGTVNSLCGRPFEDHVYVDFDQRPRQRRRRLKEFMNVGDLELAPEDTLPQ